MNTNVTNKYVLDRKYQYVKANGSIEVHFLRTRVSLRSAYFWLREMIVT
jgi:hypothetical protein